MGMSKKEGKSTLGRRNSFGAQVAVRRLSPPTWGASSRRFCQTSQLRNSVDRKERNSDLMVALGVTVTPSAENIQVVKIF